MEAPMSEEPFRFVHAGDFHLEQPPQGVAEVPDHLRRLFLEAAYWAAQRVFDAVLAEGADFLVLSGDVLHPQHAGPRGPLFLAEQFSRLAERKIPVYWAGGRVDPPGAWPSAVILPQNVHVFPQGRPEEVIHRQDATPLARLIGISRDRRRKVRASDFDARPLWGHIDTPHGAESGLFSIAVVHGSAEAAALQARGIYYWALGGRHDRSTLFSRGAGDWAPAAGDSGGSSQSAFSTQHSAFSIRAGPQSLPPGPPPSAQVAHYPGSPQGRRPEECGAHGCTLVQVDQGQQVWTSLVPTDVMRWLGQRVVVDEATTRDDLRTLLRERMGTLIETAPGVDLLVSWTVAGSGSLLGQLRRGTLRDELLGWLRSQYGFGPPAAWSLSLEVELPASLPPPWYEQETIRGDFLREVRRLQLSGEEPLELESYLAEEHLAGTLGRAVTVAGEATRQRVLREAAWLGVDLLSGEESQS
jgi:exonuclease SbcD